MKPLVEVKRLGDRIARLSKRIERLQQTQVRIMHDGGKGWTFEITSTEFSLQKALADFNQAVHAFNELKGRLGP